jgi:hypothetical protein
LAHPKIEVVDRPVYLEQYSDGSNTAMMLELLDLDKKLRDLEASQNVLSEKEIESKLTEIEKELMAELEKLKASKKEKQ